MGRVPNNFDGLINQGDRHVGQAHAGTFSSMFGGHPHEDPPEPSKLKYICCSFAGCPGKTNRHTGLHEAS